LVSVLNFEKFTSWKSNSTLIKNVRNEEESNLYTLIKIPQINLPQKYLNKTKQFKTIEIQQNNQSPTKRFFTKQIVKSCESKQSPTNPAAT
jgi:hypothetical protein